MCVYVGERLRKTDMLCLSVSPRVLFISSKKFVAFMFVINRDALLHFSDFFFFTDLFNQYNNLSERMNYILYYVYLKMLCKIGVLIRFVLFIGFCFLKEVSKAAFI